MEKFMIGVISFAFGIALALLMAYPTMWLFNYLFASSFLTFVFGTAKINFWQAVAVNAFFGIFVKSSSTSKG